MRSNVRVRFVSLALALVAAAGTAVFAGGPLRIYDPATRTPFTWQDGLVNVYTDLGPLGPQSNNTADGWVQFGINEWNNVPTSSFTATLAGDFSTLSPPLPDITKNNALDVLAAWNGGGLHIVYDTDGTIMQSVLGLGTSVLGVTFVEWIYSDEPHYAETWIVMNGKSFPSTDTTGTRVSGVFTHEMGHAFGLAHSQTNGQIIYNYDPSTGPAGCTPPWGTGKPVAAQIETMHPLVNTAANGTGAVMSTVDMLDDRAAISNLYPEAGWPGNYGTITGKIQVATIPPVGNGGHLSEYTGANVIARNVANPFGDAISSLSGDYTQMKAGEDGLYTFNGLTPGADYLVYVDGIVVGAFSTPIWVVLPGPEEWYNGPGENGNGELDDRCEYTTVTASGTATADITFNKVKGAPAFTAIPYFQFLHNLNQDGSIGAGGVSGGHAYRWTPAGGAEDLGGFLNAGTVGMSDDGQHFSGQARDANNRNVAAIWAGGTTWNLLGQPPGALPCGSDISSSWGMSGDGSTVTGLTYDVGTACRNPRAFVWDATNGMRVLQKINGGRTSRSNGISRDGHTIVGFDEHATGYRLGVRWVDGVEYNFTPNQADTSTWVGEAQGTTSDGSIIVGNNRQTPAGNRGWLWKASDNSITTLPGTALYGRSSPVDISDDGSLVVGFSQQDVGFERTSMMWTSSLGAMSLTDFLNVQGVFATDWLPQTTLTVAGDGLSQGGWAGTRFGTLAYLVQHPKVLVCHAPSGNPGKQTTLDVTFPDGLNQHLGHGDTFGLCQNGQ